MSDWEYQHLSLPPRSDASSLREILATAAAFGDWELRRRQVWPDGRQRIVLRRRRQSDLPLPSI